MLIDQCSNINVFLSYRLNDASLNQLRIRRIEIDLVVAKIARKLLEKQLCIFQRLRVHQFSDSLMQEKSQLYTSYHIKFPLTNRIMPCKVTFSKAGSSNKRAL